MRLPKKLLVVALEMRHQGFSWKDVQKEIKEISNSYEAQNVTLNQLQYQVRKFQKK